jgi:hypothetical protein|tara:strand:+ start:28 stop:723 length:696 start_codon:yes stop_codon:yes gene_type:complete
MNLITTTAKFIGPAQTESGVRCMHLEIQNQGAKALPVPIYLIPTRAAGDTFVIDAYEQGTNLLFTGRMYPGKSDHKMYIAPTTPLQTVAADTLVNQVQAAGGVGFIAEQRREDLFSCGMLCKAPAQKLVNFTWDDSVPLRLDAWGDDAVRFRKLIFKGRQMAIGGRLKYESWLGKDGETRTAYKVQIRGGIYTFFGKNAPEKAAAKVEPPVRSAQETVIPQPVPKGDEIPF